MNPPGPAIMSQDTQYTGYWAPIPNVSPHDVGIGVPITACHWPCVISVLLRENGGTVTWCRGSSLEWCPRSESGEPMLKLPLGIETMSIATVVEMATVWTSPPGSCDEVAIGSVCADAVCKPSAMGSTTSTHNQRTGNGGLSASSSR